MSVVPLGTGRWGRGVVLSILSSFYRTVAEGAVLTRDPGTNAFLNPQHPDPNYSMTFSADGTAKQGCGSYKKRPGSQKRTFQKVDARDLAGEWRGCFCFPVPVTWPLLPIFYTTKKALK